MFHKKKPRKRRRTRGEGTIFPSRRGWTGRVVVGKKPDGKPLYAERSAPTVEELHRKLAAVRPPGPAATVGQWLDAWLAALSVRGSTRDDYRTSVEKHLKPELGHVRLAELTAHHVEAACRRLAKPAGPLGPNTLRKNIGHLSAAIEAARRSKLIPDNPVKDARKPRGKKVRPDPFTPGELAAIVAAEGAGIFALLASVGCRLGEAIALDVADFDPGAGTVSITKTYDARHGTRPPKSENGVRTVRVPRQALPAVRLAAGRRKGGPLFTRAGGGRHDHSAARKLFAALLARIGVKYRSPHQTRHGVASKHVAEGVPLADVARYLGDSIETVVKTYVHPTGCDVAGAAERWLGGP